MKSNRIKFILSFFLSLSLLPSFSEPIIKCKSASECRNLLESTAKKFLGSRYSYGSSGGSQKFDCSGLVLTMMSKLLDKSPLPRSSQDMYRSLNQSVSLNDAHMGDLVFFNTGHGVSHVGMYWGKDSKGHHIMYHASSSKGVEMRQLDGDKYWMSRLVGVKRFNPISTALFTFNAKDNSEKAKDPKVDSKDKLANTKKEKDINESSTDSKDAKRKISAAEAFYFENEISYEDDLYESSWHEVKAYNSAEENSDEAEKNEVTYNKSDAYSNYDYASYDEDIYYEDVTYN